jgi:hypothetical protein
MGARRHDPPHGPAKAPTGNAAGMTHAPVIPVLTREQYPPLFRPTSRVTSLGLVAPDSRT